MWLVLNFLFMCDSFCNLVAKVQQTGLDVIFFGIIMFIQS